MAINNKIIFGVTPIITAFISFIIMPIIAWYYPVEDVGKFSLVQITINLGVAISCIGLDQSFLRDYYDTKQKGKLFFKCLIPGCLLVLILYFVQLTFFNGYIAEALFEVKAVKVELCLFVLLLSSILSRFYLLKYRLKEQPVSYMVGLVIPKLIMISLIIISAFIFGGSNSNRVGDFNDLIYYFSISVVIPIIFYVFSDLLLRERSDNGKLKVNSYRSLFSYGVPLMFSSIAAWGVFALDKYFLRYLSDFHELGIYSMAISFAAIGSVLTNMFTTIWIPSVFKWHSDGDNMSIVPKVYGAVQVAAIFIWYLCLLFSDVFLYALPTEYNFVAFVFPICILSPLLYGVSEVSTVGINLKGKPKKNLYASLIALSVNVGGNFILVEKYGALGAAISTMISMYIFMIARNEFSRKLWLPLEWLRPYTVFFIIGILSIIYAVYGSEYSVQLKLLFLFIVFFMMLSYKDVIVEVKCYITGYIKSFRRADCKEKSNES